MIAMIFPRNHAKQMGSNHFLSPNTSSHEHFSFVKTPCSRPSVMDCWHCSSLKMVEGGSPTFFENWANVMSPRCSRRNFASFLSKGDAATREA
jgi:hypothetical protein